MDKKVAVCVPAKEAQTVRKNLEENKLWDASRKLQRLGDSVAIPVFGHQPLLSFVVQNLPNAQIKEVHFLPSAKAVWKNQAQKLKEYVQSLIQENELSEALLLEVPKKWEKLEDLVILPSSAFTSLQWRQLGEKLWQTVTTALSCKRLAQHSHVADDGFRTPQVSMLLGQDGQVLHVDNGIKYSFDVTKCMFSSGNVTEKLRVASWNCSNETVVDLYAGIGYFTLPYLVHAKASHVHACEWNPDAVEALRNNLAFNRVEDRCTIHEGDNRLLKLSSVADRVNLGLIPSSEDGWPVAVRVLKPSGGVLHIHANVTHTKEVKNDSVKNQMNEVCLNDKEFADRTYKNNCNEDSNERSLDHYSNSQNQTTVDFNVSSGNCVSKIVQEEDSWAERVSQKFECLLMEQKGGIWRCEILHIEKVKSYAPRIDHVVLDLKCQLV